METERMIYLVTEYASGGEIFGKGPPQCQLYAGIFSQDFFSIYLMPERRFLTSEFNIVLLRWFIFSNHGLHFF